MIIHGECTTTIAKLNFNAKVYFMWLKWWVLVKGTIAVVNTAAGTNGDGKGTFKNVAPFADCINQINNTQVDHAKDIVVVMSMYNLIEHSDNYSKTSRNLWQSCRDQPVADNNGVSVDFNAANITDFSNFKEKVRGRTDTNGTTDFEIIAPLKYFSTFWKLNSWNQLWN